MVAETILKMVGYFNNDVRRINHALKVYGFATCIAGTEGLTDRQKLVVELASVLHDIGIPESEKKYNSCAGKYQEIEGPPIARQLLADTGLSADILDRVCFLIGNHHSYQNIDGIDFQILVEADFLVNIFEDDMSAQAVESMARKYFKTQSGLQMLKGMYP